LKRTFPQKVKPVPSCESDIGMNIDQSKQTLPESCRRTRTSAAMIGLAVSMGAQGLLLPQISEAAPVASDAAATDPVTALPPSFDVATVLPTGESSPTVSSPVESNDAVIRHRVQEGQTLLKIAQLYRVDASVILTANDLKADAVLRVGQVLQIPVDARIARLVDAEGGTPDSPIYYGLVSGSPSVSRATLPGQSAAPGVKLAQAAPDAPLKTKQDESLARLQQKRDTLRLSLGQLPTSDSAVEPTAPAPAKVSPSTVIAAADVVPARSTPAEDQPVKSNLTAVLTPDFGDSSSRASTSFSHRVQIGDTLNSIARTYGVSAQELVELNRISDPNSIFVDQVLKVPQSQSLSAPAPEPVLGASRAGVAPVLTPRVERQDETMSPQKAATGFQPGVAMPVRSAAKPAEDLTVAVAPTFTGNQPASGASVQARYDYVESLRMEIVQLRDRYRTASSPVAQPVAETRVAAAALTNAPVSPAKPATRNPEFVSSGYSESLRSQVRRLNTQATPSPAAPAEVSAVGGQSPAVAKPSISAPTSRSQPTAKQPTLVAAAPVGSQSYDPVIGKTIGRMVSPDLPPLGKEDIFLPSGSGKFAGYIWPTKGVLTSGYGYRWGRMHRGIDVAAPTGTPIVAAAPGVVVTSGWNDGGYGYLVEIRHPDGSLTLYAHNERILVQEGQQVAQGQQIAEMGSTGYSTGPHCHFEIHLPGQGAVNPMAMLSREGA
jgi:murein DD-endopeptidase MepM/ murein hydrolase activator NlpD